jgi:hypothetical protein
VNKADELNENIPMDVDMVVVVKAWDDMEVDNDPMGLTMICRILCRFTTIPWTNDVHMKAF